MRDLQPDDVTELYNMLTYMRPHESSHEEAFIQRFLVPLGMRQDEFGNVYKRVGQSPIAWSCHTDTVHRAGGMQHITRDPKFIVKLAKGSSSNCLGADDTAGVWLMVQMIKAKVPGLYLFHRGEEVGCRGSKWIANNVPGVLKHTKYVIALDRRDTDSIITFQCGLRCCSEDFATSLAGQLGDLKYKADPSGLYTDSASYTDLVGECTNLSVGYFGQHGSNESLDVTHLANLYKALIKVDHTKLVSARKPGDVESRWKSTYYGSYMGHNYNRGWDSDDWRDTYYSKEYKGGYYEDGAWKKCTQPQWKIWSDGMAAKKKTATSSIATSGPAATIDPNLQRLMDVIKSNPMQIAVMFDSWGFDAGMLRESMLDAMFHDKSLNDNDQGEAVGVH